MCGERIKLNAVKCRYCGEVFDETLRRTERRSGRSRESYEESDLSAGDIVLAILCSDIACIISIVWMIQGKSKGLKMMGLSLILGFIKYIILVALQAGAHH